MSKAITPFFGIGIYLCEYRRPSKLHASLCFDTTAISPSSSRRDDEQANDIKESQKLGK